MENILITALPQLVQYSLKPCRQRLCVNWSDGRNTCSVVLVFFTVFTGLRGTLPSASYHQIIPILTLTRNFAKNTVDITEVGRKLCDSFQRQCQYQQIYDDACVSSTLWTCLICDESSFDRCCVPANCYLQHRYLKKTHYITFSPC